MNRSILLLIIFLIPLFSFTQGINFYKGDLKTIMDIAEKNDKFIFVDCYTSWCGPCKWLEKNVFTNSNVAKFYNKNFINYRLDMQKSEGKDFARKYLVNAYPTLLFIDVKGNIQHRYVGACDTATFIAIGKQALDTTNNFGSMLRKYQSGNRQPEFLAKFALTCASVYYPYDINEYFKTQVDSQLISKLNVQIMERYKPNISSREYLYIMNNVDKFIEKHGFEKIYSLLTSIMSRTLYVMSNQNNFVVQKQISAYIDPLHVTNKEFWKSAFLLEYYGFYKIKKYPEYVNQTAEFLKKASETVPSYIDKAVNIVIDFVTERIKDTVLLDKFSKMIYSYQSFFSAKSCIKMAKVYIDKKQKKQASECLTKASKFVEINYHEKEYNELMKQLNALE